MYNEHCSMTVATKTIAVYDISRVAIFTCTFLGGSTNVFTRLEELLNNIWTRRLIVFAWLEELLNNVWTGRFNWSYLTTTV